jgi:hypothetical protein
VSASTEGNLAHGISTQTRFAMLRSTFALILAASVVDAQEPTPPAGARAHWQDVSDGVDAILKPPKR